MSCYSPADCVQFGPYNDVIKQQQILTFHTGKLIEDISLCGSLSCVVEKSFIKQGK
jgi:hypothetical protein